MNHQIEQFISHAKAYFLLANMEVLDTNAAANETRNLPITAESPALDRAVQRQYERFGKRNELLAIGEQLAPQLEAAGEDSTKLLLFLSAIDGGGGPQEAAKAWPQLKVFLQRLLMRESPPPDDGGIPATHRAGGTVTGEPLDTTFIHDVFGIDRSTTRREVCDTLDKPEGKGKLYAWDSLCRYGKSRKRNPIDVEAIYRAWQHSRR